MDVEQIRSLAELMSANDITEIVVREGESRIILRRGPVGGVYLQPPTLPANPVNYFPAPLNSGTSGGVASPPAEVGVPLLEIKAPMVGTFYAAAEPNAPPFIKVGSQVGPDTVVCIIEAMKVFNEIKSEVSGVVERVLVENGGPVEFGQTLFLVRPNP
ncbi:MAG: acetyl-CoA carboxylase biotin carboxyl carrier protein [Phycisphaerae bacterium]|nr:acetyl-CoA carboxylase biotin carboxyl carrier protein [Phycisphaerae bacterium]NUQ45248.1 acetyl-CoA carboxylase biotin carboxyl carrier protein [Phycisphaerae bacterium]